MVNWKTVTVKCCLRIVFSVEIKKRTERKARTLLPPSEVAVSDKRCHSQEGLHASASDQEKGRNEILLHSSAVLPVFLGKEVSKSVCAKSEDRKMCFQASCVR